MSGRNPLEQIPENPPCPVLGCNLGRQFSQTKVKDGKWSWLKTCVRHTYKDIKNDSYV
jgi:hypothetical protein